MDAFLSDLSALWNLVISTLTEVFNLYTTCYILIAVLGLWVVRRIFRLFEMIRP